LYVGHLTAEERTDAAGWLKECLDPGDVILASSDLTHFGSAFGFRPFGVDSRTAESLRKLDHEVMDATGSLLEDLFLDTLRRTSATVCGYEPISLLLAVLRQLDRQEELYQDVLDYQTSGEITGDFHHSVSYGATGYFPWHAFELTGEEKTELLDVARRTLDTYQRTGKRERPAGAPKLPGLERRSSVFVTLHRGGELRGCLGRSSGDESLWESVPDLTIAAATEDRRFPPLARGETGVEIEISVLSPMKRILDQSGFRVNIHGALLEAGSRHGLLLPQVATERNWGAEPFFDALARKAGVSRAACSDESTRLRVFRAQVIH
jgi:AmmeMemoRadiSam system protein A